MKKNELIEKISEVSGVQKKDVEAVLEEFTKTVIATLQKGKVVILTGFGAFSARVRKERMGVNPQKPSERIVMPTVTVPKFKAGKSLKDALKHAQSSALREADGVADVEKNIVDGK